MVTALSSKTQRLEKQNSTIAPSLSEERSGVAPEKPAGVGFRDLSFAESHGQHVNQGHRAVLANSDPPAGGSMRRFNRRPMIAGAFCSCSGIFCAGRACHVGWRHVRASPSFSPVIRKTRTLRFCLSRFLRSPASCECVYLYIEMPLRSISIAPACARTESTSVYIGDLVAFGCWFQTSPIVDIALFSPSTTLTFTLADPFTLPLPRRGFPSGSSDAAEPLRERKRGIAPRLIAADRGG